MLLLLFQQQAGDAVEITVAQTVPGPLQAVVLEVEAPTVHFGGGVFVDRSMRIAVVQVVPIPAQRMTVDQPEDRMLALLLQRWAEAV